MSRRLRLIWHKLWLIPLVGATADVVASEAAKLGGVTVPIPWLFTAIGFAGMLAAAVVRAYSVPLIPEGLETPDEALTRRSRILGERLGATPVRVFVCDLPKLRGKVDTFIDGHDLFVSPRVADLPEAERDFVLARALAVRGEFGQIRRTRTTWVLALFGPILLIGTAMMRLPDGVFERGNGWFSVSQLLMWMIVPILAFAEKRRYGPEDDRTLNAFALRATANPAGSTALVALASSEAQRKDAEKEANVLQGWWIIKGHKIVEASEWYQRELAKASETNPRSSRTLSGDSFIELPASETN